MTDRIIFKNATIEYKDQGTGKVLVLVHGYMESLNVWDDIQNILAKDFRVVTIDLPGYGNSDIISEIHSMELMADTIDAVVSKLNIEKFSLIGHSMGGYIALHYLEKYPQKLEKYCLFHSTPFEDTEEKKQDRDRIIELIKQGKKVQIAKNHTIKTFATKNLTKYEEKIGFLKIISVNTSNEGVIASLRGMRARKSQYETMKQTNVKGLWILGKLDNFINFEKIKEVEIPKTCELFVLENSGHQGYIEEQEKIVEKFKDYFK